MQLLTEDDNEELRLYKTIYVILLQCSEAATKLKLILNAAYNKSYVSSLQGSIIRQQPEAVRGSPEMQDLVETIKENSKNIYLYRGGKRRKTRYQRKRQSRRYRR